MRSYLNMFRRIDQRSRGIFGLFLAVAVILLTIFGMAKADEVDGIVYMPASDSAFYMIDHPRHIFHYCFLIQSNPSGSQFTCHGPWVLPIHPNVEFSLEQLNEMAVEQGKAE